MPIAIVLRTRGSQNTFRDVIISSLASNYVDEALLCSGFFQDNFKNSTYQVSSERSLANVCSQSGVSLTTVGIHNATWKPAYRNFKNNMMLKVGLRWHAKAFIASQNGTPNIGIVGSSNMTRNAFSTGARFNKECDVYIWDGNSPINSLASRIADELDDQIVVRAPYMPSMNNGQSVSNLLGRIRNEVLNGDLSELD